MKKSMIFLLIFILSACAPTPQLDMTNIANITQTPKTAQLQILDFESANLSYSIQEENQIIQRDISIFKNGKLLSSGESGQIPCEQQSTITISGINTNHTINSVNLQENTWISVNDFSYQIDSTTSTIELLFTPVCPQTTIKNENINIDFDLIDNSGQKTLTLSIEIFKPVIFSTNNLPYSLQEIVNNPSRNTNWIIEIKDTHRPFNEDSPHAGWMVGFNNFPLSSTIEPEIINIYAMNDSKILNFFDFEKHLGDPSRGISIFVFEGYDLYSQPRFSEYIHVTQLADGLSIGDTVLQGELLATNSRYHLFSGSKGQTVHLTTGIGNYTGKTSPPMDAYTDDIEYVLLPNTLDQSCLFDIPIRLNTENPVFSKNEKIEHQYTLLEANNIVVTANTFQYETCKFSISIESDGSFILNPTP